MLSAAPVIIGACHAHHDGGHMACSSSQRSLAAWKPNGMQAVFGTVSTLHYNVRHHTTTGAPPLRGGISAEVHHAVMITVIICCFVQVIAMP
jgi:hypothetical protein